MLIYKITNNIDGKIYIGLYSKSKENFQKYWGSGVLISRVIKKYGKENFSKEILEENISTISELFSKEIFYIDKYNSTNPKIGYNISKGGEGHFAKHSNHTKNVLSEKAKVRLSNPENHPRYGTKTDSETKEKISLGNLRNKRQREDDCREKYTSILIQLALNQVSKKDMLKICHTSRTYSAQLLTDLYRDIYEKINGYSLISHKKDKEAIEKANLKKSQTGSNKWTEEQKAKASLKMLGENNPAYGTKYQWMYLKETNKRVSLEQVQEYLAKGWLKGRWR